MTVWRHVRFEQWVLLVAVSVCAITISVVSVSIDRRYGRVDARSDQNAEAIEHLCALTNTTETVWRALIRSYETLPDLTPDQADLLSSLRMGVAEIRRSEDCIAPGG